jgi:hypothetical protein
MLQDPKTPAGLLLMLNVTLAVALLTVAFATNGTSRREALELIPLPDPSPPASLPRYCRRISLFKYVPQKPSGTSPYRRNNK